MTTMNGQRCCLRSSRNLRIPDPSSPLHAFQGPWRIQLQGQDFPSYSQPSGGRMGSLLLTAVVAVVGQKYEVRVGEDARHELGRQGEQPTQLNGRGGFQKSRSIRVVWKRKRLFERKALKGAG